MRRNPFTLIAIMAAFYAYYLTREVGRLIVVLALGLDVAPTIRYRVLVGFEVQSGVVEPTPTEMGLLILSGPGMALVAGYALLAGLIGWGNRIHSRLRLMLGLMCYLTLVLDPIYYAVIPLFRLGGEPETVQYLLPISRLPIVAIAMGLLIFNIYIIQNKLIPLIRGE